MIINNFDFISVAALPTKANPPLVIDANAVLPVPVTLQRLEPIPRRAGQILKDDGAVQLPQLSLSNPLDGAKTGYTFPMMEVLGILTVEAPNHALTV